MKEQISPYEYGQILEAIKHTRKLLEILLEGEKYSDVKRVQNTLFDLSLKLTDVEISKW